MSSSDHAVATPRQSLNLQIELRRMASRRKEESGGNIQYWGFEAPRQKAQVGCVMHAIVSCNVVAACHPELSKVLDDHPTQTNPAVNNLVKGLLRRLAWPWPAAVRDKDPGGTMVKAHMEARRSLIPYACTREDVLSPMLVVNAIYVGRFGDIEQPRTMYDLPKTVEILCDNPHRTRIETETLERAQPAITSIETQSSMSTPFSQPPVISSKVPPTLPSADETSGSLRINNSNITRGILEQHRRDTIQQLESLEDTMAEEGERRIMQAAKAAVESNTQTLKESTNQAKRSVNKLIDDLLELHGSKG
jgi:hypothetical protein